MRRALLPLISLLALALPAAAQASGKAVLLDCGDDEKLSKTYSQADYREALENMDADQRQYTSCQQVIRQAQLAAAGSRGGGGGDGANGVGGGTAGGGGGVGPGGTTASAAETLAAATPEQKAELAQAAAQEPAPVTLPGAGPLDPAEAAQVPGLDALSELPGPLGVLILLMAAGAVGFSGAHVRDRVRTRRTA